MSARKRSSSHVTLEEKLSRREPVHVTRKHLKDRCKRILEAISAHEFAWPFNSPVDAVALGLPTYHIIIKHPMDLGTIQNKLLNDEYQSVAEFTSDVRLTFQNCHVFNDKNSEVWNMATEVAIYFEWLMLHQVSHCVVDDESSEGPGLIMGSEQPNMAKRLAAIGSDIRAPLEHPANSAACGVCEQPGNLLCCDGPCLRSFHTSCVGLAEFPSDERWFCSDCQSKSHSCSICSERGADMVDVFQCAHVACGLFFHKACVNEHELTKTKQKSRAANRGNFICPHHTCARCRQPAPTALLLQCNRCVDAYHIDCLDPNATMLNARSVICLKHDVDTALDGLETVANAKTDDPWALHHVLDHLKLVTPTKSTIWTTHPAVRCRLSWKPAPQYVAYAFSDEMKEMLQRQMQQKSST